MEDLVAEIGTVRSPPDEFTVYVSAVKMPGGNVEHSLRLCGRAAAELFTEKNIGIRRIAKLGIPDPFTVPARRVVVHLPVPCIVSAVYCLESA